MKKLHVLSILLIASLAALSLSGCGSSDSSGDVYDGDDYTGSDYEYAEDTDYTEEYEEDYDAEYEEECPTITLYVCNETDDYVDSIVLIGANSEIRYETNEYLNPGEVIAIDFLPEDGDYIITPQYYRDGEDISENIALLDFWFEAEDGMVLNIQESMDIDTYILYDEDAEEELYSLLGDDSPLEAPASDDTDREALAEARNVNNTWMEDITDIDNEVITNNYFGYWYPKGDMGADMYYIVYPDGHAWRVTWNGTEDEYEDLGMVKSSLVNGTATESGLTIEKTLAGNAYFGDDGVEYWWSRGYQEY